MPTDQEIKWLLPELARKAVKEWIHDNSANKRLGSTIEGTCDVRVCHQCPAQCLLMTCTMTNNGYPIVDEKRLRKNEHH